VQNGTDNKTDSEFLKDYDGILGLGPQAYPNLNHMSFPRYLKDRGVIDHDYVAIEDETAVGAFYRNWTLSFGRYNDSSPSAALTRYDGGRFGRYEYMSHAKNGFSIDNGTST
jgi:hypothetical protein